MGGVRKAPNRPHRRSHEQGKYDQGGHRGGRAGNGRRNRRHRRRGRGSEWHQRHDGCNNDPVNAVDDDHSVHDKHPLDAVQNSPGAELDKSPSGHPCPNMGKGSSGGSSSKSGSGSESGSSYTGPPSGPAATSA